MMTEHGSSINKGYSAEECSHDEAYLDRDIDVPGTGDYVMCRRCGDAMWLIGGHRLSVIKAAKAIDFRYECLDCGVEVDYPSYAKDTDCDKED